MRASIMITCCVLAGCSREQPANEVDLNAAASQAQDDIANYAAIRRARLHRPITRPLADTQPR